jgi:23S rRNA pseudouridine1911/1915/1917 synthase
VNIEVPDGLAGERLDRVVSLVTELSRQQATDLITAGAVTVNGRVATARSARVSAGDAVAVEMPDAAPTTVIGEHDIVFGVVYEDEHLVVVDKPAGLVVHPGAGQSEGTLVHGLVGRYPELAAVGEPERPGIVHRLDAGTSGLMVVARTEDARVALIDAMARRDVTRQYRSLVWGTVEGEDGLVDAPIGRSTRERTKMAVVADGREARTLYRVLQRFTTPADLTLVECNLETGRTHQIRVHLAAIGHPVVGDTRYGRARPALDCPRPFLHAERLAFAHPITGEAMAFESALPDDLASVLATLS